MVSGSLNLPLRVLFSFRSRYYCTIGLETYLGLEVNAPQIHARYPTHTTLEHRKSSFQASPKGLSPSMVWRSSQLRITGRRSKRVRTPHLPVISEGIRFALCRVRSPLLAASQLISFPAGTKMLQSPAFPVITDHSEE